MKKNNWLYWTFGIGLIPILIRFFVSISLQTKIEFFDLSDIIFFGYVLNVSILAELSQSLNKSLSSEDRKQLNGIYFWNIIGLTTFTVIFMLFLWCEYSLEVNHIELINKHLMLIVTSILIIWYSYFSLRFFALINRINSNLNGEPN